MSDTAEKVDDVAPDNRLATSGPAPPGMTSKQRKLLGPSFKRLIRRLDPHRGSLRLVGFLVVANALLTMIGPYLLAVTIDDFIAVGDRDGLATMAIVLVVVFVATSVTMAAANWIMSRIAQQVMLGLRRDLFGNLQTLSLRFFDQRPVGDTMSRTTNDVQAVEQLLNQNLINVARSAVTLVGVIGIMIVLDWRLTIAALVPMPLIFKAVAVVGRRSRPLFGAYQRDLGRMTSVAEEQITGQRVIVAFDRHAAARDEFQAANEAVATTGIRAQSLTVLLFPLTFSFANLSTAMVVGVGGILAVGAPDSVSVGLIAAFITYAQRLGQPLSTLGQSATAIATASAGADRIFQVIDERPTVADAPDAPDMPEIVGDVVFRDVTFSYDGVTPILRDVDLHARPGEIIGLVGPTGAGKTTIINVLTRFYDITGGTVTIDGIDIRDVRQDSLRKQTGIVLQDTFLFSENVRENIRFGRTDATDEDVEAAARMANADRFIRRLPNGYDTLLSEGATNLSLGQRQLLAIARTILSDPRILILDEATSSVDTRTEAAIQQALLRLMEGRTSFVIAHRLSTIQDADQILVVDAGQIVERGDHAGLLEQQGLYAEMYRAQFRDQLPSS